MKVEIVERKFAIANRAIDPPSFVLDLRVIVWDAVDVKAKDESLLASGTSDVFVTSNRLVGSHPEQRTMCTIAHRVMPSSTGVRSGRWRSREVAEALPAGVGRGFFSANDAIGEAQLTLSLYATRR